MILDIGKSMSTIQFEHILYSIFPEIILAIFYKL